jgi:hypothetical protein
MIAARPALHRSATSIYQFNGYTAEFSRKRAYQVWYVRFQGGGYDTYWLFSDGTAKETGGRRGKWQMSGETYTVTFPPETDSFTFCNGSQDLIGKNTSNGATLMALIAGIDCTGADPPSAN